ncbi:MAG: flagellar motor switch protein FliN [Sulfobacillus acidophilus]|uniref:Flagellar motor switch protein FliN n=1 Tax=Sulfobacillus acidophilus TaxID=53633 RepID=A0A2T2WMA1_9FIRM|nr:MAG: flagellar motor switch protein FliN [Sulfobacillus acidophilus]
MPKKASRLTAEEIQALVSASDDADPEPDLSVEVKKVEFVELDEAATHPSVPESVEFVWDVPMTVEAILGTTELTVKEVLEITPGSLVELERAYGEPVDIFLNGRLVARGDVVIIGDNFGVKITEILVSGDEMSSMSSAP